MSTVSEQKRSKYCKVDDGFFWPAPNAQVRSLVGARECAWSSRSGGHHGAEERHAQIYVVNTEFTRRWNDGDDVCGA